MARYERESTGISGTRAYTQAESLDYWASRWRVEYLAPMPPRMLDETLERARRLAAEAPHSYLARHLKRLYGG